ncbi:MAG: MBL fold metallo-hydrolase [Syntrophales bacterium]|nr:MBL fold metallo-hydrolase [Syntrophales bacterium]
MVHPVLNCGFARSYIISGEDGLMVVDVGSIGTAEDVAAYIHDTAGMMAHDVRYIAATHFHIDHIGGIGHFLRQCSPETRVLFHRFVEGYLTGTRKMSPIKNWFVGLVPASLVSTRYIRRFSHLKFESLSGIPLPGLRKMVNLPYEHSKISYFGEGKCPRYKLGFDDWEVIETPGHTEESVSFYSESSGELICGDLILNMERNGRGKLNRFHWSREVITRTYHDLCGTIGPKVIYPGHGEIIKSGGDALLAVKTFI